MNRSRCRPAASLAALALLAAACGLGCQDVNISQEKGLILLAPTSVDFGTVATGLVGSQTATLSNSGSARATVSSVTIEGGDGVFTVEQGFDGELAKSESVELVLGFTADLAADHEAQLVVTSDAENPQEKYRLFASSRDPQLFVYPGYVDFGVTEAGSSESAAVSLANDALVHVTIHAATITPADAPFSVDLGELGGEVPALLGPGVTADLQVTFAPLDGAAVEASLALDTSDPSQLQIVVPLYGNDCEATFHPDFDADGDGVVSCAGDCDDTLPNVYPGAPEACDGLDNDCDPSTEIDEGTECYDDDGDGHTEADGDCQDGDPDVYPGAEELADGVDNDCDGELDEGLDSYDDDGDGFADDQGDCDDGDPDVYPGADEIADGVDQDCDGTIDEGTDAFDDDGDGYSEDDGDCDDTEPFVHPDSAEICDDLLDNDCDGDLDEDCGATGDDDTSELPDDCQCRADGQRSLGGATAAGLLALAALIRRRR